MLKYLIYLIQHATCLKKGITYPPFLNIINRFFVDIYTKALFL